MSQRDIIDKEVTGRQTPYAINTKILGNRTLIAKPIFILIKEVSGGVLSLNMPK
jgi:hypothetical protein